MHLEQVDAIQKMYSRKEAKAVKALAKMEDDPIEYLTPAKENENIDLKRQLDLKMVGLQQKTQHEILKLLKQKQP